MAKRDYYDILGINKDANEDEIKKAYRNLAKKYHPDVSAEENAEAKFKEVQEAYDTLGDQEKRANYDRFGHAGAQGFGGFEGFGGFDGFSSGGFGFSDIFDTLFRGGQRTRRSNAPTRGGDIERIVEVSFNEAVLGSTKELKVEVEENCHVCGGHGGKTKSDVVTCSECKGTGAINVEQRSLFGSIRTQQTCPKCNGSGKTIKNKCESCYGTGRQKAVKTVNVKVPAGVDNNMSLRMSGYGEGGINGGPSGDLYLRFKVRPHKVFKRNKDDILVTIPISFSQASLGDTIEVPTIYGDVELKIPAGTQPGTILRMRGKGVQNVNSSRKGDQLVTIKVEIPTSLTKKQEEIIKEFSKLEDKKSTWTKFKNLFKS